MNNRIQELKEQAIRDVELRPGTGAMHIDEFGDRLAELVLDECINKVLMSSDRHRKEYFASILRNHFGIDEL